MVKSGQNDSANWCLKHVLCPMTQAVRPNNPSITDHVHGGVSFHCQLAKQDVLDTEVLWSFMGHAREWKNEHKFGESQAGSYSQLGKELLKAACHELGVPGSMGIPGWQTPQCSAT